MSHGAVSEELPRVRRDGVPQTETGLVAGQLAAAGKQVAALAGEVPDHGPGVFDVVGRAVHPLTVVLTTDPLVWELRVSVDGASTAHLCAGLVSVPRDSGAGGARAAHSNVHRPLPAPLPIYYHVTGLEVESRTRQRPSPEREKGLLPA